MLVACTFRTFVLILLFRIEYLLFLTKQSGIVGLQDARNHPNPMPLIVDEWLTEDVDDAAISFLFELIDRVENVGVSRKI